MKPIYVPKGAAKEYGDYAVNIYTGCNHGCYYCFAPQVLHKERELFRQNVEPRAGIVDALRYQLDKEQITGKLIHLCFTCDPYPAPPVDTTATREVIHTLKQAGNHVQILTKAAEKAERDFDLLDGEDWFGITYAGYPDGDSMFTSPKAEPGASPVACRLATLQRAHYAGIKTWISMEPVLDAGNVLRFIGLGVNYVDRYKIGKLNYHPSDTNWKEFGEHAEAICKERGLDYYIKDSLRREMER